MDDYDQMRVVDLQAECKKHGLDHRGKKNELIERLKALPDAQTALSTDLSTASSIADSSNASSKDGDEDQVKDESVKSNEDVSLDVSKEEDLISESELTPSVDDIKEGADNESNTVITADSSPRSQSEYSRKRPERSISHEHSKSRSPPPRRRRSVSPECVVPDVHKYESVDVSRMYLNNYTADLNLILSDDCLSTQINSDADLSSLYACVTGSHYIPLPNDIKVGFTVKLNTSPSSESLSNDFECQIGWTLDESNNHHCLGEQQLYSNSFIYSSDGKKCNKSVFEDYFESFTNEDTITALANFADGLLTLQFAKNGKLSDEMAYTIAEDKLEVSSPKLCPYIAVRNCMFEVNFGQATGEMVDEYQWIDMCELKQRCAFSTDNKSDYEVVLMVGLPAAGKSFQTAKMIGENSDKHYYVISYENVQNRFKMAKQQSLFAKKDNVTLSHDQRDRAFNCFKRMVEEAPKRPRNYIIDNCNITREMRRKMLGPFKGFHRKAVIVVPEDSVYQQRLSQSECGKQVVLDMKSAMSLPGMDDVDEIYFAELDDDDARQLIEKYNKEGYSSKRRSERSPRNYDRYNRRSSPRSRDQRQQSSQRSRYGSSRRDWRNDSSSRMEPSRFQPRRVSPQFGRRSGMNVASGYDYGRFYGNEHRLVPYSGGQGMYGRQRRSMSPTSRQPPNAVGGSWNFSPAGPSQSGGAYRQRLFDHESGIPNIGDSYRARGMGMQPPRSSLGSDFSPSKFGPNNMPSMKHAGTPMPPRHWNRDSSGRHYGLQRTPLLQHAAAGARPSFPVGSLNSSPALINDGQKQARQMEHWQLSGKRDRSNTGPSSDWQQTKPNLGQRLPVERQWRGNAPNAGQPQWPSGHQPLSDQSANWSRQSSSRNNMGEMWSPSSNLPGARSNYQSQQTADNSKSDEHVRKSVDGDDIQQTQERWNSSERKMPPGGDHWESSDKPGYNEQSKWSRNSNDWQSPQQPKTPRMQWSSTGKSAGDRWGPSDPSHHQNVDNSWSEHSFSENDQKWNSPSRVSANESSEQWNSRRPARSSAAGDSLRQQEWGNSGTESNMDSSNLRGAWQSQRPQYPPASLHSNPQDPSWHNGLKPPTDDQGWSRAPINPSATGPYAAQASRPVDPNFGSLRQPYRMYPPQANPLARMIGTSMSSTNQAPNQYRQQSAWPQQSPNKALRPPLSLPSMSQAPPQSQNYPPARVPSAVPMQQQMRPSYPDTHNAYNNRLLSNPPQSLMMQSANPAVSVANPAGSTGGSTASISAASQQPLGSWSALSSAAASPSIAGYYSQQQLPVQPYQAVQNQAMTPQQRPSQQYQQQLGNMQTAQLQQQSTTTPLQQQYSAAFQQQQYNSQQSSAAAGAAAVAAAWSMAQSSTASTKPVASAAPTNMQASATQYGSSATLRPINAASMTAKQQLAGATSGAFSPVGTATPASYNYSSIYAAQQAAVYNQAATAATSVAAQQQPATSYQQMQQQQPYQLAAASAHHYPGGSATTGNASSYPYSAITGNSSAGTLSSSSANHSTSSAASLQQQASAGSASNLSSTTASAQLPATTSSGATTTSSTTVGAQQMIDEPTAYAGYLSAGYDQATAKAMATAYVQQQQQYYQWHQQWAAAAAVASSAQAAASANPAVSGSVATSAATIGSSGGQQQSQQLSSSSQK